MSLPACYQAAQEKDASDNLAHFRQDFHIPECHSTANTIYFAGHSLGCQPTSVKPALMQECDDWARLGVLGHFDKAQPWWSYHEACLAPMANIIGAKPSEIAIMNSLTTNLHLCLVSFFKPTAQKNKILMERSAFPSDRYAVESQCRFHGLNPDDVIIDIPYADDAFTLSTETIVEIIHQQASQLALVFVSAVHYLSGQLLDIAAITEAAQQYAIPVGVDLAHAAGCAPLACHRWNVDFAIWCNYKYLNAGPGAIGGAFIHERHVQSNTVPRFEGWWGHDKATRFDFCDTFIPIPTAERWQLSNPPIFQLAALKASLSVFDRAGMQAIVAKTRALGQMVITALAAADVHGARIITPASEHRRAGLISLWCQNAKQLCQRLQQCGIIADVRGQNILRIAPNALYNSYQECVQFSQVLARLLKEDEV